MGAVILPASVLDRHGFSSTLCSLCTHHRPWQPGDIETNKQWRGSIFPCQGNERQAAAAAEQPLKYRQENAVQPRNAVHPALKCTQAPRIPQTATIETRGKQAGRLRAGAKQIHTPSPGNRTADGRSQQNAGRPREWQGAGRRCENATKELGGRPTKWLRHGESNSRRAQPTKCRATEGMAAGRKGDARTRQRSWAGAQQNGSVTGNRTADGRSRRRQKEVQQAVQQNGSVRTD